MIYYNVLNYVIFRFARNDLYIKLALNDSTLEFEPIAFSNEVEMRAALQPGAVDCIFPAYFDRYQWFRKPYIFHGETLLSCLHAERADQPGFSTTTIVTPTP